MNEKDAQELVRGFENGTYPASAWDHRAHVVMGLWYLRHYPEDMARQRIKAGVKAYNISQGGTNSDTEGYHETLTEFYIRTLLRFLAGLGDAPFRTLLEVMEDEPFMHSAFPFRFYSKERLMSVAARRDWTEPDLRPIADYTPHQQKVQNP